MKKVWTCPICYKVIPVTDKGVHHIGRGHEIYHSLASLDGYTPTKTIQTEGQTNLF